MVTLLLGGIPYDMGLAETALYVSGELTPLVLVVVAVVLWIRGRMRRV